MHFEEGLQVSVAMCTYNGARFIEEQLWSIFGQTILPKELVVSDDNSSDETLSLVEKTYKDACNYIDGVREIDLKIIRNPSPLGITKNFEQAIGLCSYELIALSDQDDVWVPHRLEIIVGEFQNQPDLLLVHHDSELVDENLKSLGQTTFEVLGLTEREIREAEIGCELEVLLKRNIVTGATTVFRKEVYENSLPFPESWLHDEWLGISASLLGETRLLTKKLIKYRQHDSNQVGAKKTTFRQKIGRILFPRSERNKRLLLRSQVLAFHFHNQINQEKYLELVSKLTHEQIRSAYPIKKHRRFFPILQEYRTGRYSLYGLGFQDIVRDLFQSAK